MSFYEEGKNRSAILQDTVKRILQLYAFKQPSSAFLIQMRFLFQFDSDLWCKTQGVSVYDQFNTVNNNSVEPLQKKFSL